MGGQSIPALDHYLAPGVAKTYVSEVVELAVTLEDIEKEQANKIKSELIKYTDEHNERIINKEGNAFIRETLKSIIEGIEDKTINKILKRALVRADRETYQAMEALLHNFNTMHSRAGSQTPFSSVNYGTDTSNEGRMVMTNLLLATEKGMGNGETCIFPKMMGHCAVMYNENSVNLYV